MTTTCEKLKKLLEELNISQRELAAKTGIPAASLNRWLKETREDVGPLDCLCLAAVSPPGEDREFWLQAAAIPPERCELILQALNPDMDAARAADLLSAVPPRLAEQLRAIWLSRNDACRTGIQQQLEFYSNLAQSPVSTKAPLRVRQIPTKKH